MKGASLGLGASLGDLGGADAGASVGESNGGPGASLGAGGRVGEASAGISGRLGGASGGPSPASGSESSAAAGASSAAGAAAAAAGDTLGRSTATPASIAPALGSQYSISLPWLLRPSDDSGRSQATSAVAVVPGTPREVVSACRAAIETAASPFGVVRVRAKSAGTLRRLRRGEVSAPIHVRIQYVRQGGVEIRQARIRCHLDATGRVISVT